MVANRPKICTLSAFHEVVALTNKSEIQLSYTENDFELISTAIGDTRSNGYYASYEERIFAVFEDKFGELRIGWNGYLFHLSKLATVDWSLDRQSRNFKVTTIDGESASFSYDKRKSFLKRAVEVFLPDDDWDLACDLPSVVHSSFLQGTLVSDIKEMRY